MYSISDLGIEVIEYGKYRDASIDFLREAIEHIYRNDLENAKLAIEDAKRRIQQMMEM